MRDITLDHTVRSTLMKLQHPMHYYLRFLHYGIRCLEEIGYDIKFGQTGAIPNASTEATSSNIRIVSFDITDYRRVILPTDCVDVVDVVCQYGQQLLTLREDDGISPIQEFDEQGNKIPTPAAGQIDYDIGFAYTVETLSGNFNQYGEFLGRNFATKPRQKQAYSFDRHAGEIILDADVKGEKLVIVYITQGVTVSAQNVVHPYLQDTIEKYIIYQKYAHTRFDKDKIALMKRDYEVALKKARSRFYAFTYSDLLAVMREGYFSGVKN